MTDQDQHTQEIKQEVRKKMNQIYSELAHLALYQRNMFIYNLLKKGVASIPQVAECLGMSKERVYTMMEQFEKKELERLEDGKI